MHGERSLPEICYLLSTSVACSNDPVSWCWSKPLDLGTQLHIKGLSCHFLLLLCFFLSLSLYIDTLCFLLPFSPDNLRVLLTIITDVNTFLLHKYPSSSFWLWGFFCFKPFSCVGRCCPGNSRFLWAFCSVHSPVPHFENPLIAWVLL